MTSDTFLAERLATLQALAEANEQLAIELHMEIALLSHRQPVEHALRLAKTAARRLLAFRHRLRGSHIAALGDAFLQDPAMELLLEAFARQVEGKPLSLTGLHNHTESSQTTALRWGTRLCDVGLAQRVPDRSDRRREWFSLEESFFHDLAALLNDIAPLR